MLHSATLLSLTQKDSATNEPEEQAERLEEVSRTGGTGRDTVNEE